ASMGSIDRRQLLTSAAVSALGLSCATSQRGAVAQSPAHATSAPAPVPSAPASASKALAGTRTKFAANLEMWWSGTPFLEKLQLAKNLGFEAVELWPWRGKPIDELDRRARELGLEITQFTAWGFSPGMNDPKNHDAVEREIRASCEIAKKLRVRKMTVVAGN